VKGERALGLTKVPFRMGMWVSCLRVVRFFNLSRSLMIFLVLSEARKSVNLSLYEAMEAHRVVRHQGSHIF
jgi:hypothetical protein